MYTFTMLPSTPTDDQIAALRTAARTTLDGARFNALDGEDDPAMGHVELTADDDIMPVDLLALVNELLDDHAKLFNYTFPCGFKRPRLNDQEYSLDLRQRLIMAVKAAENGMG